MSMLKILIADDEKYERDSIVSLLEENFKDRLTITQAKNGREAIEISEQIRPEIVIMDIKMPGINGIKAIEEIRKSAANTYFIMLTAYDYFDFAIEAVKLNVKEYLLKPFVRSEFITKINNAINIVEQQKAKRKRDIEKEEKINNLIGVLENELSYSIINNNMDNIDLNMYMDYLNIDFNNAFSINIKILETSISSSLKKKIGEYISEYLKFRYKAIGTYRFIENIVYFIQIDNNNDKDEEVLKNINIAKDVKREIERHFNVFVKIGLGNCYNGINLMNRSYEEATNAVNFSNQDDIIHISNIDSFTKYKDFDNDKTKLFNKVKSYITDNLKEDLNLESIAHNFNLSPYYFSRSFKEVMGCNLTDYINTIRIKKAKELLIENKMSIKEIGYTVGYSDPNYFSKVFKKYEGYSPKEYKFK